MKQKNNNSVIGALVRFFSSVKLAIVLFILLAVTSIIGTVLPQGESLQFYLENFGPFWFKVIKQLQLYDTYHAWWYLTLLGLFSINLVVCTLKRLPYTLRLVNRDGLDLSKEEIYKRPLKALWSIKNVDPNRLTSSLREILEKKVGAVRTKIDEDGTEILFAEKGKWNYWGVYFIHVSILVIFAGAIFGSFTGFKGRVLLLEGESTDHALIEDSNGTKKVPLGFTIRCDNFDVEFYPDRTPKLFKSDVVIIDNQSGKELLKRSITVNDPLTYNGITFYQSTYDSLLALSLKINTSDGQQRVFRFTPFKPWSEWPEKGLLIGLKEYYPNVNGVPAAKVFVGSPGSSRGRVMLVIEGTDREFKQNGNTFRLSLEGARVRYMTGLQVKKDPGVPIVWLGCTMMILGFAVVFWIAHKRYWLVISKDNQGVQVLLAGQSNKNKTSFEREFDSVKKAIEDRIGEVK